MNEIIIDYNEDLEKINLLLNRLRENFNLKPKRHESNLIFKDKRQEILHILRYSCDEMFSEYTDNIKLWKNMVVYH